MRETLGTPNNRVVILCKLRKAQRGVIVVYIRDSERHQIERCRELGVKVHKRSEVCLFHLELGFFGQRFRLWIGLPSSLKVLDKQIIVLAVLFPSFVEIVISSYASGASET